MTFGPLFIFGAGLVGVVFGGFSGAQHSLAWTAVGSCIGLLLGVGSWFAVTVPYTYWIVRYENRHPGFSDPPRIWAWLFLPLMIGSLVLAVISSWFVVTWLVRWFAD